MVGGGPAGASAALGLRRAGFAVRLVEQRAGWTGRVCGAFLDPFAVAALNDLGIRDLVRRAGAVPVDAVTVTLSSGTSTRIPLPDGRCGLALPRHHLEDTLLDAVRAAGGIVEMGTRALDVRPAPEGFTATLRDGGAAQRDLTVPLVVLADGRFTVAFPANGKPRHGWFGWNAEFTGMAQPPGTLSIHFLSRGYVGALTFPDGRTNVCGLTWFSRGAIPPWESVWLAGLDRHVALRALAANASRETDWRGVGPLPFRATPPVAGGTLVAGDAAAVGEPFMGEGIGRALSAGPMLERAIAAAGGSGAPVEAVRAAYAALWSSAFAPRLRHGAWARRLLEHPWIADPALRMLVTRPMLLNALIPALTRAPAPAI